MSSATEQRLRYRLLTGFNDQAFCQRVSEALNEGYALYGSPTVAHGPDGIIAAQAVILHD